MNILSILRPRTIVAGALALIVGSSAYGFAAANTLPTNTNAGSGTSTVSGYTVTAVTYLLEDPDVEKLDKVSFNLAPNSGGAVPTVVKIQLDSTNTTWLDATRVGVTNVWEYDPAAGALDVADVDVLNIVAHD